MNSSIPNNMLSPPSALKQSQDEKDPFDDSEQFDLLVLPERDLSTDSSSDNEHTINNLFRPSRDEELR